VLLSEESDPVDHLLGAGAGGLETSGEAGVLALEKLHALRRHDPFDAGDLEAFEARFGLKRAPPEGCQLVAEMLDELLQLTERGSFRSYAV
jgi:hypothetical protein